MDSPHTVTLRPDDIRPDFPVTMVGGVLPQGADALRERLRWAAAERRWTPATLQPQAPAFTAPVGRAALRDGAQLTRYLCAFGHCRT